jgi:POT family proton-dependent oligopeptide transporter
LVCGTLGELYGWHWGFAAAGIGMFLGLIVYISGSKYLPVVRRTPATQSKAPRGTFLLLIGIGVAVTVFRGAYEQVGNTVALWAQSGVDRQVGAAVIPMTWFQALNPLLVFLMTPLLLARWRKRTEPAATRKMATGAFIVALAYALLAGVAALAGPGQASWIWLVGFFVVYTWGELHILPTGLGLFARLAPTGFAATTVAAWFLATFSGSLAAGVVGTLWSSVHHAQFFLILALLAVGAAGMLLTMDRSVSTASP